MTMFRTPRFWLLSWGGIGAAALLYVIVASSVQPSSNKQPSASNQDLALLTGEMSDFQYAFPPRAAPVVPFQYEGQDITLEAFRGKTILVNFWATWCAPCLKELPTLDALEAELGGRDFQVVAIASDPRGPEAAQQYLDRLNIKKLKLYADPKLTFAYAIGGANMLPVTILYDAEGVEIGRLVGEADWSSPEAIRLVSSVAP